VLKLSVPASEDFKSTVAIKTLVPAPRPVLKVVIVVLVGHAARPEATEPSAKSPVAAKTFCAGKILRKLVAINTKINVARIFFLSSNYPSLKCLRCM